MPWAFPDSDDDITADGSRWALAASKLDVSSSDDEHDGVASVCGVCEPVPAKTTNNASWSGARSRIEVSSGEEDDSIVAPIIDNCAVGLQSIPTNRKKNTGLAEGALLRYHIDVSQ